MERATTAKERLFTRPFVLAFVAHFLHCISFNLFVHLPGFLAGLGASEVEIGVLVGLTAATAVLARPLLGKTMDTRGRRVAILGAGALHVAVCAGYELAGSLGPWLYACRLFHGLAEATLFAALFAFAADWVPASRRIEGMALFGVSGMLPMSLGALLGDLILAHHGYRALFAAAGLAAAGALAASFGLHDRPVPAGAAPPRGFVHALLQADLVPIWIVGTLFASAIAAYFTFLKTFVLTTGIGSVGRFFTAYSIAAIVLRVGFGTVPERIGAKRALYPALASLGVGLVVLAHARTATAVVLSGLFCGLGHGFTFPILLGLVVARARASERGSALALYTALFDGGTLVGAPLLGFVVHAHGYRAMYLVAACAVGLGSSLFVVLDRGR